MSNKNNESLDEENVAITEQDDPKFVPVDADVTLIKDETILANLSVKDVEKSPRDNFYSVYGKDAATPSVMERY